MKKVDSPQKKDKKLTYANKRKK